MAAAAEALNFLGSRGYRVSLDKVQIAQQSVKYLGHELTPTSRSLTSERKSTILSIPIPATKKQLQTFLGMAGFCRLWIPNFGLIAKPLYDATQGPDSLPLEWGPDQNKAFETLKASISPT